MKITHRNLLRIIKEEILLLEQEGIDIDIDDDDECVDCNPVTIPDDKWYPNEQSTEIDLGSLLTGGPIQKFLTQPVASGRFNIGSDEYTLQKIGDEAGAIDQKNDPDAISPDGKHSKKLYVVNPLDRSSPHLMPRAAWQNREMHHGQDIFGILGDPVPAYITGYVEKAKHESGDGGNVVILANNFPDSVGSDGRGIYPENTEFIRYAHLDTIASISPGDIVGAGEIIGTLGCTGNCGTKVTAPHIHFSISKPYRGKFSFWEGEHRDPYDLFDQSGWLTNRDDLFLSDSESAALTKEPGNDDCEPANWPDPLSKPSHCN